MTHFTYTPSGVGLYNTIFIDPLTGQWTIPTYTYVANTNPFNLDVIQTDVHYHKRVVSYFYTKLIEKWLYKDPLYQSLLKYFKVSTNDSIISVSLVDNTDQLTTPQLDKKNQSKVFLYLEKVFITKKWVRKILTAYVNTHQIKWYNLIHNSATIKDLFVRKLETFIVSTIYQSKSSHSSEK